MRPLVLLFVVAACQADLDLSTSAQPIVVVTPVGYDFGTLVVGMTSAPLAITVAPAAGAQADLVTAVSASCPDFTITAPALPGDVSRVCAYDAMGRCTTTDYLTYQFSTTFHPLVAGAVSCVVTIETNNTTHRSVTLTGTGSLLPLAIAARPSTLAFGDVRQSIASAGVPVDIRNGGSQTLTVSSVAIAGDFAITAGPTTGYTISAGGSQPYTLTCNPTALGAVSGTLMITSDDPTTPTLSVPLSCTGSDSSLEVTPSPATVPATRVGEPVMQLITLHNTSAAAMTLDSLVLTGADFSIASGPGPAASIGVDPDPTASVPVQILFGATARGDATATLVATYDGGTTRTTQIFARALGTSMSVTPDGDVDLGPVCVGLSKDQSFTLLANDQATFTVSQITLPDPNYTLTPPTLPATIQGSGATTLAFSVNAAPAAEGSLTGTLTITTDLPAAGPRAIHLRAEALAASVSPTPTALDLGTTAIGALTSSQTVHVTNCTAAAATLANPRLEGPDAMDFTIVTPPASLDLAPGEIASWLIAAQPHTAGPKSATFAVDTDTGTVTVALDAEGLTPPATAPTGRPSYYACAVGSSAEAWPIGLAIALLRFRRRRR